MSNPGVFPGIGKVPRYPSRLYGTLANRPAPTGSGMAYFATDDALGTDYLDIVSGGLPVWVSMAPRGLLGQAILTSTPATLGTTNVASVSAVSGLSVSATATTRPLRVACQTNIWCNAATSRENMAIWQYVTSAGLNTAVAIADSNLVTGSGTTAGAAVNMSCFAIQSSTSSTPITPGINYTWIVVAFGPNASTMVAAGTSPTTLTVEEV